MYKVDVTIFRAVESEKGFPKIEADVTKVHELFHRTIGDLYSKAEAGTYTVILYAAGTGGEVPLLTQLVNVPRKSAVRS
jgi:hypothetical protein